METRECDVLIIGSGIAGLMVAVKTASRGRVVVLTKKEAAESNTNLAQGGIAAVTDPADSFDKHIDDTMIAGAGLCHRDAVELVVSQAPYSIALLREMGANFSHSPLGKLDLGQEGGHSSRRIVHAMDHTGEEVEKTLLAQAEKLGVEIRANSFSFELLHEDGVCIGALTIENGRVIAYRSRVTLLCSGGAGKVYLYTSNPEIATGDGMAMAYRAGCRVGNMEFVQFHPTCLYHPKARSFLISEAVRGEGAQLLTADGRRFMPEYDDRAELAPRDIVARAIDSEMKSSGDKYVLLDATIIGHEKLLNRFPYIYARCLELGYDIAQKPFPVVPAAHYFCGGVMTDLHGRTDLKRLYAVGEVSFTGVHGANRLASNSLLEAVVIADRAAEDIISRLSDWELPMLPELPDTPKQVNEPDELVILDYDWDQVRRVMWDLVGIVRSDDRLRRAAEILRLMHHQVDSYFEVGYFSPDLIELRNIRLVGELIVHSAIKRKESRGLHFNRDHPHRDDENWRHDTLLRKGEGVVGFNPTSTFRKLPKTP